MSDILKDATARPWCMNYGCIWEARLKDKASRGKVAEATLAWKSSAEREANARLIVTAVNAYEPMLAALEGLEGILATAESNASGNPEWEYVSGKINAARGAIAQAKVVS